MNEKLRNARGYEININFTKEEIETEIELLEKEIVEASQAYVEATNVFDESLPKVVKNCFGKYNYRLEKEIEHKKMPLALQLVENIDAKRNHSSKLESTKVRLELSLKYYDLPKMSNEELITFLDERGYTLRAVYNYEHSDTLNRFDVRSKNSDDFTQSLYVSQSGFFGEKEIEVRSGTTCWGGINTDPDDFEKISKLYANIAEILRTLQNTDLTVIKPFYRNEDEEIVEY